MKEYYVDIKLTNELEDWILLQGAKVSQSNLLPMVQKGKIGTVEGQPVVFFGHRQIHFYSSGDMIRMFFNDENRSTALLLFVKFPELIVKHTIPREPNDRQHRLSV